MAVVMGSKAAKQQKATIGGRAWRLLRLAVLWARRGSAVHSLRLLNTLRRAGIGHGRGHRSDRLRYGEREYSIEDTPAFRFRTPSARVLRLIPCIAPAVPVTPGLYGDDSYFFRRRGQDEPEPADQCGAGYYYNGETSDCDEEISCDDAAMDEQLLERAMAEATAGAGEDAGVDLKAEEFIAKFYAQMKLQRQISWLQYNEMMERSIC